MGPASPLVALVALIDRMPLPSRPRRRDRPLDTSRPGPYPHADAGAGVCQVFHEVRSRAIENVNGRFKAIFDGNGPVPTRGLAATTRSVLGAALVYQLTLLHRAEAGADPRVGLKPFLQAA